MTALIAWTLLLRLGGRKMGRFLTGGSGPDRRAMLAILATHPIQYRAPVWKLLASRGRVPFEVLYLSAHGVEPTLDPGFGEVFRWDLDLLERVSAPVPRRAAPRELGGFWATGLPRCFRESAAEAEGTGRSSSPAGTFAPAGRPCGSRTGWGSPSGWPATATTSGRTPFRSAW